MSQIQIANRYAKSLIDLAVEQSVLEAVYSDIQTLAGVCKHPEFLAMLNSPIVNSDKKQAVVDQLFGGNFKDLSMKFIHLMISKARESVLPAICQAFDEQYKAIKNIRSAMVTTPVELTEAELDQIKKKFSFWLNPGETMELGQKLDQKLIGGFIFEMGDRSYDASIKRQMDELKDELYDTSYISLVERR